MVQHSSISRSPIRRPRSKLPAFASLLLLILFLLVTGASPAAALTVSLQWRPSEEADVAGYKLYFGNESYTYSGNVDVGNVTSYTLTGLDEGKVHYFAATAYNRSGVESEFSNQVSYPTAAAAAQDSESGSLTVAEAGSGGGGGGGGGCFIATAIFGPHSPEVFALRQFRDSHLLTNGPGKKFVELYYASSPRIAKIIEGSPVLRAAGRWILAPVVYGVQHASMVLSIGGLVAGLALFRRIIRRR